MIKNNPLDVYSFALCLKYGLVDINGNILIDGNKISAVKELYCIVNAMKDGIDKQPIFFCFGIKWSKEKIEWAIDNYKKFLKMTKSDKIKEILK